MDQTPIESRIVKCLENVRAIQKPIVGQTLFKRDLDFESIDVVDLLFTLEQEFAHTFTMTSFNDFVLRNSESREWDFSFTQLCRFVSESTASS